MFKKVFLDHPAQAGETYGEHFAVASGIGGELILAGLGCWLHALVPAVCKTTGSAAIRRLHRRVVADRVAQVEAKSVEWVI